MTAIQPRPQPLHPTIDTWAELQAWIDQRLEDIESALGDGETLQSIGIAGKARLDGLRAQLLDLAFLIRNAVAAESAEQAQDVYQDAAEAQWKESYPDADELTLRRLGGDR